MRESSVESMSNKGNIPGSILTDTMAPWPGPHGRRVRLGSDLVEVEVLPDDGCRMSSIRAFGHEILRQFVPGMAVFQYGAFPMVPWAGRLGGGLLYWNGCTHQMPVNRAPHALHGLGCFGQWEHASQDAFYLDLDPWWPWPATAGLVVDVDGPTLTLTLSVEAQGRAFPAQLGLHPWFRRHLADVGSDAPVRLSTTPAWQAERGANGLPTGRRIAPTPQPWDDSFGFAPSFSAGLEWDNLSLSIASDHQVATLFTEKPDALCVEPQTSVPNALNSAPEDTLVKPNHRLSMTTTLTFAPTVGADS